MNTGNPNHDQPIDVGLLLERCMDDASLALMVLAKFEEQAASDLAGLVRSVATQENGGNGSTAEAARRAHALRGTAGAIGATELMNAASQLEEAAHTGTMSLAQELATTVVAEIRRCLGSVPTVRQELATRATPPA